ARATFEVNGNDPALGGFERSDHANGPSSAPRNELSFCRPGRCITVNAESPRKSASKNAALPWPMLVATPSPVMTGSPESELVMQQVGELADVFGLQSVDQRNP